MGPKGALNTMLRGFGFDFATEGRHEGCFCKAVTQDKEKLDQGSYSFSCHKPSDNLVDPSEDNIFNVTK